MKVALEETKIALKRISPKILGKFNNQVWEPPRSAFSLVSTGMIVDR